MKHFTTILRLHVFTKTCQEFMPYHSLSQIASFSVTPNYEIIFFSSEIYEVVNILDFLDANVELKDVIKDLEKFEVGGESRKINFSWF